MINLIGCLNGINANCMKGCTPISEIQKKIVIFVTFVKAISEQYSPYDAEDSKTFVVEFVFHWV